MVEINKVLTLPWTHEIGDEDSFDELIEGSSDKDEELQELQEPPSVQLSDKPNLLEVQNQRLRKIEKEDKGNKKQPTDNKFNYNNNIKRKLQYSASNLQNNLSFPHIKQQHYVMQNNISQTKDN